MDFIASTIPPLRAFWKLLLLGICVLLLLVPVSQVLGLVRERQSRQEEVTKEIADVWAQAQTVAGIALDIPYRPIGESLTAPPSGHLIFLPSSVRWTGKLEPQTRKRGLFGVTVYEARLEASGWFAHPDPVALGAPAARIDWSGARVLLGVTDPRGLQQRPVLRFAGSDRPFTPAPPCLISLPADLQAAVSPLELDAEKLPFALTLVLRGSESLRVLPLGDDTMVELSSPWPHPGFVGAPLPRERTVAGQGFAASWSVPYFGRGYPQRWREGDTDRGVMQSRLNASSFGVELVRPADPYQQTERAVKYAVLFILLTFTTVFVLELLSPVRLHPMTYLLVGGALCLFYVLLLALGEHMGVERAYAVATAATVLLVTLYARAVLRSTARSVAVAGVLAILYGWLYVVLSAEEYALLLGAAGLFVALAAVMFLTRRLDWSTLRFQPVEGS